MAKDPSVVIKTELLTPTEDLPYLNRALYTFRPSTSTFLAGFIANAEFVDPDTLEGLVAEVTINNFESKLKAWGATTDEPIYQFCQATFFPLGIVVNGTRFPANVERVPSIFLGRRTRSVNTQQTIEFTTNTAGSVVFTINPSKNNFEDGWLFQTTIVADGVLTVANLRDAAVAALNADAGFAALYLAAPVGVAGEFTITSLVDGFPLIVKIAVTSGGPIMTSAVTTANVPGDYALDLDDIQRVAEDSDDPITGKPERRWFWITDVQGDPDVNAEGYEWVQDERELTVPIDYQFHGLSRDPLDFDPLSAGASEAEVAAAANGGAGWNYASVCFHDLWEWPVAAIFGRTIAYLPGDISFTDKVLIGSVGAAKITPRDQGDNASLADERHFNYNSPEGPRGSWRWGYLADGSFWDRDWITNYATYVAKRALEDFKLARNIVQFTNDDINAGKGAIVNGLLTLPAFANLPDEIVVTAVLRQDLDPVDITNRTYVDYTFRCGYGGVINRMGTTAEPIIGTITESLA